MTKPILIYCYDAYCGWCYGFSTIIKQTEEQFKTQLDIEVLSGGLILPQSPVHVSQTADYINKAYKIVENTTGAKFGKDYLWHIENPDLSDWFPHSLKPAIALCILKELHPEKQVNFAVDLQFALHFEGRDLTDNEAYRHLLDKYEINEDDFYKKLASEEFTSKARQEFSLCKQLQATGFPTLLLQMPNEKIYAITNGYTNFETIKQRIELVLNNN